MSNTTETSVLRYNKVIGINFNAIQKSPHIFLNVNVKFHFLFGGMLMYEKKLSTKKFKKG